MLALLALAGLLRPDAWVLSGVYWLWCWPGTSNRTRLLRAAIVASAPLIWVCLDAIVTGNPLYSLHRHIRARRRNSNARRGRAA